MDSGEGGSGGRKSCVVLIALDVTRPLLFRALLEVLTLTVAPTGAPLMVRIFVLAVAVLGMMEVVTIDEVASLALAAHTMH